MPNAEPAYATVFALEARMLVVTLALSPRLSTDASRAQVEKRQTLPQAVGVD